MVRQDDTGDCKEDIAQSTATDVTMHNRRNEVMPNSCEEVILDLTPLHLVLEAAAKGACL